MINLFKKREDKMISKAIKPEQEEIEKRLLPNNRVTRKMSG